MSNTKMTVKVSKRTVSGKDCYEGLVTLPNLSETKLRKSDGSTYYGNITSLRQAAQVVAEKYFLDLNFVSNAKVAAKKSTR